MVFTILGYRSFISESVCLPMKKWKAGLGRLASVRGVDMFCVHAGIVITVSYVIKYACMMCKEKKAARSELVACLDLL